MQIITDIDIIISGEEIDEFFSSYQGSISLQELSKLRNEINEEIDTSKLNHDLEQCTTGYLKSILNIFQYLEIEISGINDHSNLLMHPCNFKITIIPLIVNKLSEKLLNCNSVETLIKIIKYVSIELSTISLMFLKENYTEEAYYDFNKNIYEDFNSSKFSMCIDRIFNDIFNNNDTALNTSVVNNCIKYTFMSMYSKNYEAYHVFEFVLNVNSTQKGLIDLINKYFSEKY